MLKEGADLVILKEQPRRPFQEVWDAEHRAEWTVSKEARQEMEWYASYVELWGVMRPIGNVVRAHPWMYVVLIVVGYLPFVFWWLR